MKHKAKTWNYCWPDDPQPGLLHLEPPALSKKSSFSIQCCGGTSEEQDEIARRIAALWNAAERVDLSTEDIENGKIERALERIEKLEALIATAPEMLTILEELRESASYWSEYDVPVGIVDRIESAIRKARDEE